jgi:hypothetical protein
LLIDILCNKGVVLCIKFVSLVGRYLLSREVIALNIGGRESSVPKSACGENRLEFSTPKNTREKLERDVRVL